MLSSRKKVDDGKGALFEIDSIGIGSASQPVRMTAAVSP
jgi:hypothetical protein